MPLEFIEPRTDILLDQLPMIAEDLEVEPENEPLQYLCATRLLHVMGFAVMAVNIAGVWGSSSRTTEVMRVTGGLLGAYGSKWPDRYG